MPIRSNYVSQFRTKINFNLFLASIELSLTIIDPKLKLGSVFDKFLFILIFNGQQYIVISVHIAIFTSPIFENIHHGRVVLICRTICRLSSRKSAYPIAKLCIQAKRIKIIITKFDQFFTFEPGCELYTILIKRHTVVKPDCSVRVWLLRTFYSE